MTNYFYRVDFTRSLRELLRLTGPVENVHQENPRQLINFVGNTNMPLILPSTEYNNIKVDLFFKKHVLTFIVIRLLTSFTVQGENSVETETKITAETCSPQPDFDSIEGV